MRKLKLILKKIYQFHMDMDITHLWVVLILFPIFLDTISTIPLIVYKITDTVLFFIELDVLIVLLVKSFYKINKRQLVFIGLCVIIFLFNIAIFKNFSFFMSNIRSLLLNLFIPTWIMLGESRLIKKSKDFFIRLEMPLFVLIIINGIIRIYEHDLYNIWFAYYVYTNIAISLYKAIIYKKKPSYLIASFLIGFQLLSGSRAPLIYILLLAFILAFPGLKKRWKKLRRKIKIVLLLPAIVIIALCINYQAIAKSLDTALMKQGKIVRIIHIAAKGELFTSARSDLIYKPLIEDIENNLIKVSNVKNAAVVPVNKDDKIAYLTAFVELKEENGLSSLKNGISIKKELGKLIPSYMIPRNIKIIKQFPTNVNGKIDRKKLLEEIK